MLDIIIIINTNENAVESCAEWDKFTHSLNLVREGGVKKIENRYT